MGVIQIGSVAILLKWVLLAAAILIGLIAVWIWLNPVKGAKDSKQVLDLIFNSIFVGFFAWKGSLLLLEPGLVMKQPLSLLYFTGGKDGLIIAIIIAVSYFYVKAGKEQTKRQWKMHILFFYSSAALGFYHVLYAVFLQKDILFHLLIGTVALLACAYNKKLQVRKSLFSYIILFSFYYLILSLFLLDPVNQILLFTSDQWLFFILILLSLYFSNKNSLRRDEA